MNPEDIVKVLDEIGERVGPYGEAAWNILVRQTFVEGIVWGAFNLFVFVAIAMAVKYGFRLVSESAEADKSREHRGYDGAFDGTPYNLLRFAILGLAVVPFLAGAYGIVDNVLKALNPQYYALLRVLDTLP